MSRPTGKVSILLLFTIILLCCLSQPVSADGAATLASWTVFAGNLRYDVTGGTTSYSISVPYSLNEISIRVEAAEGVIVTISDIVIERGITYGPIQLQPDSTAIVVKASDASGNSSDYTLQVNKLPVGHDASLNELYSTEVAILPQFTPDVTEYSLQSQYRESIEIRAFRNDNNATMKINGDIVPPQTSKRVWLSRSDTKIVIEVIAEDGITSRTYTISITWLPSSMNRLHSLTASAGTLIKLPNINDTEYKLELIESKQFTVTATASDNTASIKINGEPVASGQPSQLLEFENNELTVSIVVTAENGDSLTYTVFAYYPSSIWQPVGEKNISGGMVDCPYLYVDDDGTPYVTFSDRNDKHCRLSVMMYNGSHWIYLGSQYISQGRAMAAYLTKIDGALYVAFSDNKDFNTSTPDLTKVMSFNGKAWEDTGSGLPDGYANRFSISQYGGKLYVAYGDYTDSSRLGTASPHVAVLEGGAWVPCGVDSLGYGSGLTLREAGGSLYCAYTWKPGETTAYRIRIMRLEQSGWVEAYVTSQESSLYAFETNGDSLYALAGNSNTSKFSVIRRSGGQWENLPFPTVLHSVWNSLSMGLSESEVYFAYYNISSGKADTYRYDGSAWVQTDVPDCAVSYGNSDGYIFSHGKLYDRMYNAEDKLDIGKLQRSDDATLTGMMLRNVAGEHELAHDIAMKNGIFDYDATVFGSAYTIRFCPTAADQYATVRVNGTGVARGEWVTIPIAAGKTDVAVTVCSSDGTNQSEYKLTVTRPADATLDTLSTRSLTFREAFHPDTLEYHAYTVDYRIDSITVSAQLSDTAASLSVNGSAVTNGQSCEVPLQTGESTIRLEVRSADGTETQAYTIQVKRAAGSWQSAGSTVPITRSIMERQFLAVGDSLYYVYRDNTGRLYVQRNRAGIWQSIDPDASFFRSVSDFSITELSGVPVIAYIDDDGGNYYPPHKLRVLQYQGGTWSFVGGTSVGVTSDVYVSTATSDGVLYVSYISEEDANRNLIVKAYDGSAWQTVGEAVSDRTLGCELSIINGTLYVAYCQTSGSSYSAGQNLTVSVKKLENGSWVSVGQPVITMKGAGVIDLFSCEGSPCLDYFEREYYISSSDYALSRYIALYSGGSWVNLDGLEELPGNGLTGRLVDNGGKLYYAYREKEYSPELSFFRRDGEKWVIYGSTLLADTGDSTDCWLTFLNGVPYTLVFHADKTVEAMKYQLPDSAALIALSPASGSLSPAFSQGIQEYSLAVAKNVTSVTFTLRPEDRYSTVTVNGEPVSYGSQCTINNLAFGNNDISVKVVSADGSSSKIYVIHVNRELVRYSVCFSYGDNTLNQTVDYGGKIQKPSPAPTRAGYTFSGWFTDSACKTLWNFDSDTVTQDITLYGEWIINKHTISFVPNGGSFVAPVTANYDTTITVPSIKRAGYTLQGWFTDSEFTEQWDFSSHKVVQDTTLYAKWNINTYTVTFNPQNNTASTQINVDYGNTIPAPLSPTRPGYVFQGWYREPSCLTPWNFATDTVTSDITLYAKWVSTIPASVKAAPASYVSITVSWSAVPGTLGYELWRAPYNTSSYVLVKTTTSTSFTNTGLVTGKYYSYKVRSYSGSPKVYSGWSAISTSKPIPSVPASVRAARYAAGSIRVSWGAVSGATRYEVYRCTTISGTYTLAGTTSSLYYVNTRLTAGRTYYFKVRAYHLEGSLKAYGNWSAVVSAKP